MSGTVTHVASSVVARRFGVTPMTVRRWVKAGVLTPVLTTPGGHMRFRIEDVEALAHAHEPKSA